MYGIYEPLANLSTLPPPRRGNLWVNQLCGLVHEFILVKISRWYCKYYNQKEQFGGEYPLPFGFFLKWTHGTREEEALAMQYAYTMGIPAPRFISYGSHGVKRPGSILMTFVQGIEMNMVFDTLSPVERETIHGDLAVIIQTMRQFESPWGSRICSVDGTAVVSHHVGGGCAGPSSNEAEFRAYLESFASPHAQESREAMDSLLARAHSILTEPHRVVFTHGDLLRHNIMVHEGHISAIIDWECAGWLPDYWEYTSMSRMQRKGSEWERYVATLDGNRFQFERECDVALWSITDSSWNR